MLDGSVGGVLSFDIPFFIPLTAINQSINIWCVIIGINLRLADLLLASRTQEKGNIKFNNRNKITKPLQFQFNYFEPFTKSTNLFTPNFYKQISLNNKINNRKIGFDIGVTINTEKKRIKTRTEKSPAYIKQKKNQMKVDHHKKSSPVPTRFWCIYGTLSHPLSKWKCSIMKRKKFFQVEMLT